MASSPSPSSSGTAPGNRRRALRTTAVVLALLGLLAAARALIVGPADITDPIEYSGSAGEPVDAERFTVDVRGVEFARAVSKGGTDPDLGTDRVWMLVSVTLTATTEDVSILAPVELETGDGLTYAASGELSAAISGGGGIVDDGLEPGVPLSGVIMFEVPPKRVTEPHLRLTAGLTRMDRLTSTAVVDLEMDDARVRRGVADAAESAVVPSTERGRGHETRVRPEPPDQGGHDG